MIYHMPKLKLLATALILSAGAAYAAVTPEQIAAGYTAQGYTRVEIKTGPTQMKVEAIRGTEKLEVIIDTATGAVLKTETEAVGAFENTRPGVSVRDRNRDFLRVASSDDDDNSADDNGIGNDDLTEDPEDHDHGIGNDDGPGHDANDDQGEDSEDHGGNDAGNDDHSGPGGNKDNDDDRSGKGGGGED
jgi:hypothetical protein